MYASLSSLAVGSLLAVVYAANAQLTAPVPVVGPAKAPAEMTLVLSMNEKSELVVAGRAVVVKPEDTKAYLAGEFRRLKRQAEQQKLSAEPALDIRALRDAKFRMIHQLMLQAKEVGFRQITVHAERADK